MIARDHDHLHRSDLAQTVDRAHQQLPAAQERFLVTDRLVLRRTRRGRAAEMIGVQKIIPADEQDFLRRQRRRFGQQILQREDEHALANLVVVGPAGFQLGTVFSEVVVHDGYFEQSLGACAMNDWWLDRRGLTELPQYPLHEVLEFFLGNFAPQPRLDLEQHAGRHSLRGLGGHFVFVDDVPFDLPNDRVHLGIHEQVGQGLDARAAIRKIPFTIMHIVLQFVVARGRQLQGFCGRSHCRGRNGAGIILRAQPARQMDLCMVERQTQRLRHFDRAPIGVYLLELLHPHVVGVGAVALCFPPPPLAEAAGGWSLNPQQNC